MTEAKTQTGAQSSTQVKKQKKHSLEKNICNFLHHGEAGVNWFAALLAEAERQLILEYPATEVQERLDGRVQLLIDKAINGKGAKPPAWADSAPLTTKAVGDYRAIFYALQRQAEEDNYPYFGLPKCKQMARNTQTLSEEDSRAAIQTSAATERRQVLARIIAFSKRWSKPQQPPIGVQQTFPLKGADKSKAYILAKEEVSKIIKEELDAAQKTIQGQFDAQEKRLNRLEQLLKISPPSSTVVSSNNSTAAFNILAAGVVPQPV